MESSVAEFTDETGFPYSVIPGQIWRASISKKGTDSPETIQAFAPLAFEPFGSSSGQISKALFVFAAKVASLHTAARKRSRGQTPVQRSKTDFTLFLNRALHSLNV